MTGNTGENGIFCLMHKQVDYGLPENSLQCGAAVYGRIPGIAHYDDEGDNISNLNRFYLENTGIWWIWKHIHTPIKGNYQYRRRLDFSDAENLLKDYRVITCEPLFLNVRRQYAVCHNVADLDLAGKAVCSLYPDYADDWEKFIVNGDRLWYSNGYCMKAEDYDAYCEWLFNVLGEWLRMAGVKAEDIVEFVGGRGSYGLRQDAQYQAEIGAFLSERLFTLYVRHNFGDDKIKSLPYQKFEGIAI